MKSTRLVPVLLVALALVGGACGGGGGGSNSAYCKKIREVAAEAAKTTSTSAPNMKALQTAFDKALDKIATKAPSEIKDDYDVLQQYVDLRFAAVITPAKADTKKAQELLPKYTEAQKNITDYNKKVCKYSPTTTAVTRTVTLPTTPTSVAAVTTVQR
jgi:hypothetical protein